MGTYKEAGKEKGSNAKRNIQEIKYKTTLKKSENFCILQSFGM